MIINTDIISFNFDDNNHKVYTPGTKNYTTILKVDHRLSSKQSLDIYGYGVTNLNPKVCDFDQDKQECIITFDMMKETDDGFPTDLTKAQIVARDSGGYISQIILPICGDKPYLTILPRILVFDEIDTRINMKAYYCNAGGPVTSNKDFFIDKYNKDDHYNSRGVCYDSNGNPIQQSDPRYCHYIISPDSDWFNLGIAFPEHNKKEYELNYGINDTDHPLGSLTVKALPTAYMRFGDASGFSMYSVAIPAGKSFKVNWFQKLMYINIVGQDDIVAKVMMKIKGPKSEWQDAPAPFSNIINGKYYDFASISDLMIDTGKVEITQPVELKIVFSYRKYINNEIHNNELLIFLIPNK